MLLPLLGAAVAQYRDGAREHRRDVAIGTGLALLAALAAYLIANPYSLLDFHAFRAELELQSHYTEQSQSSWIGGPKQGSFVYYLWSFTWGLGWVPALAALGGAVTIWRRDRRSAGCSCRSPCCICCFRPAGALLRPLVAADLPRRLPSGGEFRARAPVGGATRTANACARRAGHGLSRRCWQ